MASNASVCSLAIDISAVGVPGVEIAAGERRGVDVRENSSDGTPSGKTGFILMGNTLRILLIKENVCELPMLPF